MMKSMNTRHNKQKEISLWAYTLNSIKEPKGTYNKIKQTKNQNNNIS